MPRYQKTVLEKVWQKEWMFLKSVKYPWMHVKGPFRAMIATLMDLRWDVCRLNGWRNDLGETVLVDCEDPYRICCMWQEMQWTIQRQQFQVVAHAFGAPYLESGFDCVVARRYCVRLQKTQPKQLPLLDATLQGTLRGVAMLMTCCIVGCGSASS